MTDSDSDSDSWENLSSHLFSQQVHATDHQTRLLCLLPPPDLICFTFLCRISELQFTPDAFLGASGVAVNDTLLAATVALSVSLPKNPELHP